MTDNWPEILRDAAELVEENWSNHPESPHGFCILEAVSCIAEGTPDQQYQLPYFVYDKISSVSPLCSHGDWTPSWDTRWHCWHYNDWHCSGGQEAAQILQKAAALMEEDVNLPY